MWRPGQPVNDVLLGSLWLDRVLIFLFAPILLLALIGGIASRRWAVIPVVLVVAVLLYGVRRGATWILRNSARS
jgi:hypothetical protein